MVERLSCAIDPFWVEKPTLYFVLKTISVYCTGHSTTTEKTVWYDSKIPRTKTYEEHILRSLINRTIEDVSRKEAVGYDAVSGMIDRRIDAQVDWNSIQHLGVIGIDKVSLKKGHQVFIILMTSRGANYTTDD